MPAIITQEVFKWLMRVHSYTHAIQAVSAMQKGHLVDTYFDLEVAAAKHRHSPSLSMADSSLLVMERSHRARVYSLDCDFQGLNDVESIAKHG